MTVQELIDQLIKLIAENPSIANRKVEFPCGYAETREVDTILTNENTYAIHLV